MKQSLVRLLSKPKVVIPVSIGIALIIGALSYNAIGRAPIVTLPSDSASTTAYTSGSSINLSFLRTGRLATVAVQPGAPVHAGEVLATLDAADALGVLNQAKGALELAKAQYASLNVQYANAKKQQDVLVANAYRTLLSGGLAVLAKNRDGNQTRTIDDSQLPQVSGTYSCDRAGTYEIYPYASKTQSGYSFNVKGLEEGSGDVTYYTPQSFGTCGLSILFPTNFQTDILTKWVIEIPNTRATVYAANKNAYDLAVATRDQVLKQLEANLGKDTSTSANVAEAAVHAAEGTYESAQAAYNNTRILAPTDGTVSFVDPQLKVGQTVAANKVLITITSH